MYARLDDELLDHRKIFAAGEQLGADGPAIALGFYAIGLLWANRQLSDGDLPTVIVNSFRHVGDPMRVADALVAAGLWEKNGVGFHIHDYAEFGNPSASKTKARRKRDRDRKRRERSRDVRKRK